jgi:hypothetical protein
MFSGLGLRYNSTKATPPKVYQKIAQELKKKIPMENFSKDHKDTIKRAQTISLLPAVPTERTQKWGKGLLKRLSKDGGDKIITLNTSFIHYEYTRFIKPCGEIKGLSLNDALLQLDWSQNRVSKKMKEALKEFIIRAKEEKFNLEKTYIADAYVLNTSNGLAKKFVKKYLKGRGRYGSTPHAKVAKLQIILQERDKPFQARSADPLEWIRARLRERKRSHVQTADEIYTLARIKRPVKVVYA